MTTTTSAATNFINIGERTNVTGSAKFRKLIEADDYAAAFGATVSELIEVSDLERGFIGGRQRLAAFAESGMADDAAFAFEPAVQTVSGQVTVSFTLDGVSLR